MSSQNINYRVKLEMFNIFLFKSIFVFTTCPFLVFAQHLLMHHRQFYKMSNKSMVGNVTETQKVEDYLDCSFLCLEYGPFHCLSFNFGKANDNGYYTCELSNSERYLEPQRMQERSSYDYYGTIAEVSCKNTFQVINSTRVNRNHDQNIRFYSEPFYSLTI